MPPAKEPAIDQRIMKALSHPLRVRMLTLLNQKVSSPSEIAEELDEPLGNVSYHMRFLADLKMVKLVRTEPRRGAVEHYYQALEPPQAAATTGHNCRRQSGAPCPTASSGRSPRTSTAPPRTAGSTATTCMSAARR